MMAQKGSQKWLQIGVDKYPETLNAAIRSSMEVPSGTTIEWLSPLASEDYVEYRDEAFITKLGLSLKHRPLGEFWPTRGPVWDGLARTAMGDLLLVEAKGHIPEMVSPASKASPASLKLIEKALAETRAALAPRTTV